MADDPAQQLVDCIKKFKPYNNSLRWILVVTSQNTASQIETEISLNKSRKDGLQYVHRKSRRDLRLKYFCLVRNFPEPLNGLVRRSLHWKRVTFGLSYSSEQ